MPYRVIFPAPRQAVLEPIQVPDPGEGEVKVRGLASLISTGTEMTAYTGDFPAESVWARYIRYPFAPGYNLIGVVEAVGPGVARVRLGDRVAVGTRHADWAVVPQEQAIPAPAEVAPDELSFYRLGSIALNGVRQAGVAVGESAVVVGCGPVGQMTLRWLRLAGLYPLIAVDLAPARREAALRAGADLALHPEQVQGALAEATGGRLADLVFEVTGAPPAMADAVKWARRCGKVVVLGSPRGPVSIDFHDDVHTRGLRIIGAHNGTSPRYETPGEPWTEERNIRLFFEMLRLGRISVSELISHRLPLMRAPEAYELLLHDRAATMGVVLEIGTEA